MGQRIFWNVGRNIYIIQNYDYKKLVYWALRKEQTRRQCRNKRKWYIQLSIIDL